MKWLTRIRTYYRIYSKNITRVNLRGRVKIPKPTVKSGWKKNDIYGIFFMHGIESEIFPLIKKERRQYEGYNKIN